jgi:hypothetical protein
MNRLFTAWSVKVVYNILLLYKKIGCMKFQLSNYLLKLLNKIYRLKNMSLCWLNKLILNVFAAFISWDGYEMD